MAFNLQYLNRVSAGGNANAATFWSYLSTTDSDATVQASNYFLSVYNKFAVGDIIYTYTTDGSAFVKVTASTSSSITVSVLPSLAAGSVALSNLATGIKPSHVVKFAGKAANSGGSATVAITVTGLTTSHVCFAQVQASSNAVTVQKVTPTADTMTVLLSGDPGATTTIAYQALLVAS